MFRFMTIIRELVLCLAKVINMLKHSVKLRCYMLCGGVTAAAATPPHNITYSTQCFNIFITLARHSTSSLMMVENRNM
jgi:hypothetical protein